MLRIGARRMRFAAATSRNTLRFATLGLAVGFASLGGAAGCGSSQKKDAQLAGGAGLSAFAGSGSSRCDASGKKVVTGDTNGDGKPDVWKYYGVQQSGGQEVQALACKERDLNHDGKLDIVDLHDASGVRVASEFDLDFDGRFDQKDHFQNGKKVRTDQDTDFDGRPDLVVYYEVDKVVRIERDTNADGKIDEWSYYENGKLDRIGYDTTGSGRVDKWDRAPEEPAAAPGSESGNAPAPAGGTQPPPASTEPPAATAPPPASSPPPAAK